MQVALNKYRLWQLNMRACHEPHVKYHLQQEQMFSHEVAQALNALVIGNAVITSCRVAESVRHIANDQITVGKSTQGYNVVYVFEKNDPETATSITSIVPTI